jgi:flagellar operon protein
MPDGPDKISRPVDPLLQRRIPAVDRRAVQPKPGAPQGASFETLLQRELQRSGQLSFSAHAQKRLNEANINLDAGQMARLENAVQKAAAKGAKESLVLMDNLALVVSIRNRTVITAVDGERMRDNVFTNIDSAVIT